MVTQITRDLRRMGATELSARDVLRSPTVAGMAALVERALRGVPAEQAPDEALADEVVLDEAIRADGLPAAGPGVAGTGAAGTGAAGTVLLTGATGFVGAFLCAELLRQTPATVLCLVRAADAAEAAERVRANLAVYGLAEAASERIGVIVGDLARPLLGLDQAGFDDLAQRADEIYHCGARVNFVRPYRALKAANVLGTQEVLRLAATGRLKPVHYISTLAVLAGAMTGDTDRIAEDDPLPPPVGHDTAYSQSKWVAEGLIGIARQRGIPVSVYRAGGVLADSRTGASNRDDYVTKVIQGCVQLGLAPLRDYRLSVGTVDHLARLVVGLARRPEALGRAFHTIDPQPLAWNAIFDQLRRCGYPVRSVPFDQWRRSLTEQVDADGDDNALAPLMAMIGETPDRRMPEISCANVLSVLGPQDAGAPALDTVFFERMLRFFVHERLLPQPASASAPRG